MRIYRDLQTVLNLVGAPGFEPGTPCSQSIYKEGECLQLAHSSGRDADIFTHSDTRTRRLQTIVRAIVRTLDGGRTCHAWPLSY